MIRQIAIQPPARGLHEITATVEREVERAGIREGICTLFIRHTSASLLIQENADPAARSDLENWLDRLVPEDDPLFTHTTEGPDDMPSHVKSALTSTSLSIPILEGRLALGTWQGIYLWEHRHRSSVRHIVLHISG